MKKLNPMLVKALVCSLLFFTSGCVYYRFYQVRKQLGDFTTNFQVVQRDGPTIISHNPVIRPGDVKWLLGFEPTGWVEQDQFRVGQYHLQKLFASPEADEEGRFDIPAEIRYETGSGLLKEFHLPARFSKIVNEDFLVPLFAQINKGQLKHREESHSWSMGYGFELPPMGSIIELAGQPYREEKNATTHSLYYRYHLKEGGLEDIPIANIKGLLVFRRSDYRIVKGDIRVGTLHIMAHRKAEGGFSVKVRRDKN